MLDIAAGHGLFGIAIANRFPKAHVTALDWANVLAVAQENAPGLGLPTDICGNRAAPSRLPGAALTTSYS